jgi:methyl-accepting chemotaxis protein
MNISDDEFFCALKTVFDILPTLFNSDAAVAITDAEKFVLLKDPKTFKLNFSEGTQIPKGGIIEKAIKTKKKYSQKYPKEAFGFPITAYAVPIINPYTNNAVGAISYAISLEKENGVIEMVNDLQTFSQNLAVSSEELASSTQEISSNSQNINSLITETQTGIVSMNEIITYIKSIADTTKLLGINAAIEAARAGEHGRGFSVVAGEIRKLAANSHDSTTKINETLSGIKENINTIISILNEFSITSEGQAVQAEQIAIGSQKLNELSTKLLHLSQDISN